MGTSTSYTEDTTLTKKRKKVIGLAKDGAVNHREDGVDCQTVDRAPASMKIEQFASITTDRFVWLGAEQFAREGGQSVLSCIG
jgi:hypothetical protein